jgi:hypothetical protein
MRRYLGGALLLVCLLPRLGWAQFAAAVFEVPGPLLTETTWTSLQQTLNTVEAIFQSAEWVLDLTPYDEHGAVFEPGVIEEMISRTQAVLWDISRIEAEIAAMFNIETAPDNTFMLQQRLLAIRQIRYQNQSAARRVQSLPSLVMQTLTDLKSLWARVLDILGGKQGHQQAQDLLVKLNETQVRSEMTMSAFQQAALVDAQEQTLIDESLKRINTAMFASVPRR